MSEVADLMMEKLAGNAEVVDFLAPIKKQAMLVEQLQDIQNSKLNSSKEEKVVLEQYKQDLNAKVQDLWSMLMETSLYEGGVLHARTSNLKPILDQYEFKLYIVKKG